MAELKNEELGNSTPEQDLSLKDQIIGESSSMNPIDSSKPYMNIQDMLSDDPNLVPDQYRNTVSEYRTAMDQFGPEAIANSYMTDFYPDSPGLATGTYNPMPEKSSYENEISALRDSLRAPLEKEEGTISAPIWDNVRALNFDRAYESNMFSDIGFTPYADMDQTYNRNHSAWDGWSRGWDQFKNLAGTGMVSSYRSLYDLIDGDDYLSSPDLDSAFEMEDAMRIGGSTDGSFMGKLGNIGLNFGYTAGIVASVAVEEAVAAVASAAMTIPSGGASWSVFGATTLRNLGRIGNLFDFKRAASASSALLKSLNKIESARDFYRASKGALNAGGKLFVPEITHAIKNWKTTGNTAQNLLNIGKNRHIFGAFYRDVRMINASMSESKMEAGMVYNRVEQDAINYFNYKNGVGKGVTNEQAQQARVKAAEAAFSAQMRNFLIIHASNRIVLRNAFGGWQRKIGEASKRVLATGVKGQATKGSKWLLSRMRQEYKISKALNGWKAAPKVMGSQLLRYGAANFAEGIQEVSQEAISSATVGYYSSLLRDPLAGAPGTYGAYGTQAAGNLFSAEGAEVFASGFLMGGLAGPYQQVLFQGMPALYRRGQSAYNKKYKMQEDGTYSNPYKEYNDAREKAVDDIVSQVNKFADATYDGKNPLQGILSPEQLKLSMQKQIAGELNLNIAVGDRKSYGDNRNMSEFNNLFTAYQNGSIKFQKDDLKALSKLNDKDLEAAFGDTKRTAKSLRKKIGRQLNLIDEYGKNYAGKLEGIFPSNRYDLSQLKRGTVEYNKMAFRKQAFEHSKMLYIFTNESFKDAVKRQAQIEQELESEPLFGNQSFTDIRLLYTNDTIQEELSVLQDEINASENLTPKEKELTAKRKKKRAALEKYSKIFNDPKNQTKKGYFAKNKVNSSGLKGAFKEYIQMLAGSNNDFINYSNIDNALTLLTDHVALQEDASAFSKSVDWLANPEGQKQIEDRTAEYLEFLYSNRKEIYARQTKNYLDVIQKNDLINAFSEKGILVEEEFLKSFLEDDITIEEFTDGIRQGKFIEDGRRLNMNIEADADKLAYVIAVINTYAGVVADQKARESVSPETVMQEEIVDIEQVLQEAEVPEIEVDQDNENSDVLRNILEQQYIIYRSNEVSQTPLTYDEWKKTGDALKITLAFDAIKRVWAKGYKISVEEYGVQSERTRIPTIEEVKNEKGFQEFLDSREGIEDPTIQKILSDLDLTYDIFTNRNIDTKSNLKPIKGGDGVMFRVIPKDVAGTDEKLYQILNNTGAELTAIQLDLIDGFGVYNTKQKAIEQFNILEEKYSDGKTFKFDGLNLVKGQFVYDKITGEAFRITRTPLGTKLTLVSSEDYGKAERKNPIRYETELDFSERFYIEKLIIEKVDAGAAKVKADDAVAIYAREGKKESKESAKERLNYIVANLDEEGVSKLTIKVSLNNELLPSDYSMRGAMIPNPYIKDKGEKYNLEIAITDPDMLKDINEGLVAEGLKAIDPALNGTFAHLSNDRFIFEVSQGKVFTPATMSIDLAKQVFVVGKNQTIEDQLEKAKNSWADNDALISFIDGIYSEGQTEVDLVSVIGNGFRLNKVDGYADYDGANPMVTLQEFYDKGLTSNGAGGIIIYDNTRSADGKTIDGKPNAITNIADDDLNKALLDEAEAGLKKNGSWQKMIGDNSMGYQERYQYAIKQSNGTWTLATAKTVGQDPAVIENWMSSMMDQVLLMKEGVKNDKGGFTTKPSIGPTGNYINGATNASIGAEVDLFNKTNNEGIRIAMNPGTNLFITVAPFGKIRAVVETNRTKTGVVYLTVEDIKAESNPMVNLKNLMDKVNTKMAEVESPARIALPQFSTSLSLNATVQTMMESLATKLTTKVRRNATYIFQATSAKREASNNKAVNVSQTPVDQAEANTKKLTDLGDSITTDAIFQETEVFTDAEGNPIPKGPELTATNTPAVDLTSLAQKPLDQLNSKMKEIEQTIKDEVGPRGLAEALRKNEVYQKLKIARDKLIANKIALSFTESDIKDLEEFTIWAQNNLPSFITIEDIRALGSNMLRGGIRVGGFALNLNALAGGLKIGGTIYTGSSNPFKYHEAFHSVYRLLLTPEEQANLRSIARKEVRAKLRAEGKSFAKEIQKFKNSAEQYDSLSKKELENLYYEEYMADQFQLFKNNATDSSTSSEVKSFFTRLLEWIKGVFSKYTKNELSKLFENINAGKYANAQAVSNDFTDNYSNGVTIANAMIPYKSLQVGVTKGELYLESSIANNIVLSMAAMYIERQKNNPSESEIDRMNGIISDFAWLYNKDNEANIESISNPDKAELLSKLTDAFLDSQTYDDRTQSPFYKAAFSVLDTIDFQKAVEEDLAQEYEQEEGLRNVTQFGKETYLNGSFSSLSTYMRKYLATITREEGDIFGNQFITRDDGREEKLIVPINVYNTYNGIMKAVTGRTEPIEILQSLAIFADSNPDTKAAVSKIFNDLGLNLGDQISEELLPTTITNSILFNQLKAFVNFKVEWLFQKADKAGNVITFSAAERDDANTQLSLWSQAFTTFLQEWKIRPQGRDNAVSSVAGFRRVLLSGQTFNKQQLTDQANNISKLVYDTTGIKLSPLYVKYSILKSNGVNDNDTNQQLLLSLNTEAEPISAEQLYFIQEIIANKKNAHQLYSDEEGAAGRLKMMAVNNAIFDETIGLSVFKNVNGDLVNTHQKPTFHLKRVAALNNLSEIDRLLLKPYLRDNYLLNSEEFLAMSASNLLKIKRVSGIAEVETLDRNADYDQYISGVLNTTEYGSFTATQFLTNLINNYTLDFNTKSLALKNTIVNDETQQVEQIGTAPVQIRVLESSNTDDKISLPVIEAVAFFPDTLDAIDITPEAIDIAYSFVKNEYNRIVREQGEEGIQDSYKGYEERKNTFFNNSDLISDEVRLGLEQSAKVNLEGKTLTFEEALSNNNSGEKEFRKQLKNRLNVKYDRFKSLYDRLNIDTKISKEIKSGLIQNKTGDARAKAVEASAKLNMTFDKDYNLKQIFLNDYLNTKSINELLLGDQALILKDAVDQIKRAKGQNAAYDDVYTSLTSEKLGVTSATEEISVLTFTDPVLESYFTGKDIERADAQMYITTKAFRHFWFGLGKLTQQQADVITKIEKGEEVTTEDIFGESGLIATDGMLNSKKFVHFDGESFIKMSAFVLTPEYTSIDTGKKDDNGNTVWAEHPLRPELHKLRQDLERLETTTGNVSIATPVSAQKMAKKNIQSLTSSITEPSSTISAKDFGLQVINPSNKNKVTEVSQIKILATNEQNDKQPIILEGYPGVTNIADVKRLYNDALKKRITLKYKNKRNLTFSFDGLMSEFSVSKERNKLTPDLAAFMTYAVNSLKASKSSGTIMEFFSIDPISGEPKFDFNNPLAAPKAQQLFLSYFTKDVFQEKIPGHGLALVSDFGNTVFRRVYSVEEVKQKDGTFKYLPLKHEVIREDVAKRMSGLEAFDYSLSTLSGMTIPKEGIVIVDRLRYGLQEFNAKGEPTGLRYSEGMMPAHLKDVYEKIQLKGGSIPDVIAKMFAVRIPSQDNHSTMNIKLVDFMPVYYGSSAMFPAELIEVSGADFDIDKVYTQIKEYYYSQDDSKFYAYGETKGREYADYVEYINNEVQKDNSYSEAVKSFKVQGSKLEDSYDDSELLDTPFTDSGLKAVTRLGLPATKKAYNTYKESYGEPYLAPYNNISLDMRFALMGNESVQNISVTPASLLAVEQSYEYLKRFAPNYVASMDGAQVDVDDAYGKTISFINNKGAAIGRAVSPNLYLSLLSEYKVKINPEQAFVFLGKEYTGFDQPLNKDGQRKQDEISAVITMLTDNSKENYMSKLGMHRQAVPLATNLVALGMPLKEAILLLNVKEVRDLFEQAANKENKFDPSFASLVNERLYDLREEYKLQKELGILPAVEREEGSVFSKKIDEQSMGQMIESGASAQQEMEILDIISKINKISSFTGKMNSLTGISGSAGLGRNFASIAKTRADLVEIGAIAEKGVQPDMDISRILENSFVKQNLNIFNEITNELLPVTFLTATDGFTEFYNKLKKSLGTESNKFTEETEQKIKNDMLSYFTIKAYMNNTKNTLSKGAGTLSNQLIYPIVGAQNIFDSVRRLNGADKDNFFLKSFITQLPISAETNIKGLNLLEANTWRNLNKLQNIDLQTSFAKLYGNPNTRRDAMTIVNYIMVKDGLQLASQSLLQAISPFVLDGYLQQITNAKESLLNDNNYEETFGLSKEELFSEFETGYLTSNVNALKIVGREIYTDIANQSTVLGTLKGQIKITEADGKRKLTLKKRTNKADESFEYDNQPAVIRIYTEAEQQSGKMKKSSRLYKLLPKDTEGNLDQSSYQYIEVPAMGSNFQNGIGFMFGPRDTYAEVRENITNKGSIAFGQDIDMLGVNQDIALDTALDNMEFDRKNSLPAQALGMESANVSATEDSVDFQIDSSVPPVNIAQVDANTFLESLTTPTEQTSKVEISSNAKGLAAALTNPTELAKSKGNLAESYPITFNGKNYKDVEAAYQALKDKSEARTKPTKENSDNYRLMVDLISAKLEQHPRLVSSITEKGGVDWISSSTHQPTKQNTVWETGGQNWFIESLADAYIKTESEGIVVAEDNMPKLTPKESEQLDLFEAALEDKYPLITEFYNQTINAPYIADEFSEMRKNLADNKIVSLESLIALYEDPELSYDGTTEEEKTKNFLDEIKRCNL